MELKWLKVAYFLTTMLPILVGTQGVAAVRADAAYDRAAYRLELVRNQIELTIANHSSQAADVRKQERELRGMRVYEHIPLARNDLKDDRALLDSVFSDFKRAAELDTGYTVRKIEFATQWRHSASAVPTEVNFDSEYKVPEKMVVDRRELRLSVFFEQGVPPSPDQWLKRQQGSVRRLLEPLRWHVTGKLLTGTILIFRYRDFAYPRFLAPDLAQYSTPGHPENRVQKAAFARIERYRRDIMKGWPEAQPFVDKIREFALNDLRLNFFLEHAKISGSEEN